METYQPRTYMSGRIEHIVVTAPLFNWAVSRLCTQELVRTAGRNERTSNRWKDEESTERTQKASFQLTGCRGSLSVRR